eukprot:13699045-Alexandrium_andersonii.AAC.1
MVVVRDGRGVVHRSGPVQLAVVPVLGSRHLGHRRHLVQRGAGRQCGHGCGAGVRRFGFGSGADAEYGVHWTRGGRQWCRAGRSRRDGASRMAAGV